MRTRSVDVRQVAAGAALVVLPVAVVGWDQVRGRRLFDEGLPLTGPVAILRALVLILAVSALLAAVATIRNRQLAPWPDHAGPAIAGSLVVAAIAIAMVVGAPEQLFAWGQEDGVVENLSAALFVVGGVGLLLSSRLLRGATRALAVIIGLAWVFAAGEEISWGQRLFDFSGPAALTASNLQAETNLHNLATDAIEAAFYAGLALFTILLPFVRDRWQAPAWASHMVRLIPRGWLVAFAAPAAGMNLDQWDVVPLQLTFWATLGILGTMAYQRHRAGLSGAGWCAAALMVTATVQIVALVTADQAVELHDITEFKELFLGLTVAAWGLDVLVNERRRAVDVTSVATTAPNS